MRISIKKLLFLLGLTLSLQQLFITSSQAYFDENEDAIEIDYENYPTEYQEEYDDEVAAEAELQREYEEDQRIAEELLARQEEEQQRRTEERQRMENERIAYEQALQEEHERARLEEERQQELEQQRALAEEERLQKIEAARIEMERQQIEQDLQQQAEEDARRADELRQRKEAEKIRLETDRKREQELQRTIAEAERKARELQRLKKAEEDKLLKELQREEKHQRDLEQKARKEQEARKRKAMRQARLEEKRNKAAADKAARHEAEQEKKHLQEEKKREKQAQHEEKKRLEHANKLHAQRKKQAHAESKMPHSATPNVLKADAHDQTSHHHHDTLSRAWLEEHLKNPLRAENMTTFHKDVRIRYHLIIASKDHDVTTARTCARQIRDKHRCEKISPDGNTVTCLNQICSISAYLAAQKYHHIAAAAAALHATEEALCSHFNALQSGAISFNTYYQNGITAGQKAAHHIMQKMHDPYVKKSINKVAHVIAAAHEIATSAVQEYLASEEAPITAAEKVVQQEKAKKIYASVFTQIAAPENRAKLLSGNRNDLENIIKKARNAGNQYAVQPLASENDTLNSLKTTVQSLIASTPAQTPSESFAFGTAIAHAYEKLTPRPTTNNVILFTTKTVDAALHGSLAELSAHMDVQISRRDSTHPHTKTTQEFASRIMQRRSSTAR